MTLKTPFLIFVLTWICTPLIAHAQEKKGENYVVTLSDTSASKRTESTRIDAATIGMALPKNLPAWSVEKITLHGGKQEGCELITIDNGAMKIVVVPTRGMSIFKVTKYSTDPVSKETGMELSWNSPVKEVVHPQYIHLESRGGLGWLEGFNEWMVRCGLESAGHPGKDEFVNNVGDKVEMNLTLHGKIGNIPASKVMVVIEPNAPHRIRLQGIVNERMFYGPKFELITEISTELGSTAFRINDQLVNHGAEDQEFQMIYHTNFGRPLLEKGAQTLIAAEKIEPMNGHAAKSIKNYSVYEPPTRGFTEQVYLAYPKSDASGKAQALLKNAAGDRGVSVRWQTSQLPFFTLWKNTAAEADGYVTGLEPGTGFPFNRNVERKFGRVPKIGPGETRSFELEYSLHDGKEKVSAIESEISKLQGEAPRLIPEPVTAPSP